MYITIPYSFKHYGTVSFLDLSRFYKDQILIQGLLFKQEYYSSGLAITCKKCEGQRDLSCSAGNGMIGVTAGHFQSFGVTLGSAGCGLLS